METRDRSNGSASAPEVPIAYIVTVCTDMSEAEVIGHSVLQLDTGFLITYCRTADLRASPPAGEVALFVLATDASPEEVQRTLEWLRHYWPQSTVAVVGGVGAEQAELAARVGGAAYLVRPVGPEQWQALIRHAIGRLQAANVSIAYWPRPSGQNDYPSTCE